MALPRPPGHLSPESRRWWKTIVELFELEAHHLRVLTAAAEAFDRKEEARRLIAAEGLVVRDRFGTLKPHPAAAIERDSRLAFGRLVRELDLDVGPPREMPRVAGRR